MIIKVYFSSVMKIKIIISIQMLLSLIIGLMVAWKQVWKIKINL